MKKHRYPGQGAQSVSLREIGREARAAVYKSWMVGGGASAGVPAPVPGLLRGALDVVLCVAAFACIGFILGLMA